MVFSDRLLDAIREEPTRCTIRKCQYWLQDCYHPLALGASAFKENG